MNEGKVLTVRAKSPILRPRRLLDIAPKSTVAKRKSVIIKPAEEAKINEKTAGVAAVATGFVVASATVVITNETIPWTSLQSRLYLLEALNQDGT